MPAGTATHLRAFLLVEHHGPWGLSAPRDSRLPDEVKRHFAGHRSIKILLARRHHRAHRGSTYQAMLCVPSRRLLLGTTFEDPLELCDLDLEAVGRGQSPDWEPVPGPVYGVCTHGRHDACCAERGRPVCQALTAGRPEETWEVSHVGGDRFAPNMVVLPEGLYYGRLDPESVTEVADLHEAGRLHLDHLRGRSTYPMPVQYAEVVLRRRLGEDRLDAVRLVERDGGRCEFAVGDGPLARHGGTTPRRARPADLLGDPAGPGAGLRDRLRRAGLIPWSRGRWPATTTSPPPPRSCRTPGSPTRPPGCGRPPTCTGGGARTSTPTRRSTRSGSTATGPWPRLSSGAGARRGGSTSSVVPT